MGEIDQGHGYQDLTPVFLSAATGSGGEKIGSQSIPGLTMRLYLDLLRHVLDHGAPKSDRTGDGTVSISGAQLRFALVRGVETRACPEGRR